MPTKLYVVLASAESDSALCYSGESLISFSIKSKNQLMGHSFSVAKKISLTRRCVSRRGVWLTDSHISRISPQKQIFQQNHFSLLIKGSGGLYLGRRKSQKISRYSHFQWSIRNGSTVQYIRDSDKIMRIQIQTNQTDSEDSLRF